SRPNVTIISPTAGTYHPPSLLINASISDEFSTISSVKAMIEFWVPFNFNISMTQSGTYWFCYWDNISEYQNGNYTIKIWAIDEGGNVNQTQFIVIMIDNPPIVGDGDGNSSDGDKESSEWLLIVIIISAISAVGILSVVSALLIKNRSKPLMMPQSKVPKTCSLCSKKHTEFWILCKECYAKQQKIPVSTICPTCKSKKNIEIPKLLIDEAKTIMTISIPKGLMCDHHFQAFVDKNFKVRGYQKVDFEGNSKQILAKK
ncbi:MAG: Ig-like domain-containing protein, partial [Candidatus Hodarchaeota archaeon]